MRTKQIVKNSLVTLMTLAFTACTSQQPNVLNNTSNVAVQSDNVSVIKVSDKGADISANISFGQTFSTKANVDGIVEKRASDIQFVSVYVVELSTDPMAGGDPLATGNIIFSTATDIAKTTTGQNFNLLLKGLPPNSDSTTLAPIKKYYVGVVAKDINHAVISKIPTTLWGTTTNITAPSLSITSTGVKVATNLSVNTSVALPLNVYLQDAIGAKISTDVTATNGSPVTGLANGSITSLTSLSVIAGAGISTPDSTGTQSANSVALNGAARVATDTLGNIYLSDFNHNQIEKIDTNGIIQVIAGNGSNAPPPSVGTQVALSVGLNQPSGVAVDNSGNVYIADYGNGFVEKIDTNGLIRIIAGNAGGVPPTTGLQDATAVKLTNPIGVTVDSTGNVYISDYAAKYIEKVDTNNQISIIAGGGATSSTAQTALSFGFGNPDGLILDSAGNLLIADRGSNYIEKLDTASQIISIIAGNAGGVLPTTGLQNATSVKLNSPIGIVKDTLGNIYISDASNNYIEKIDVNNMLKVVAGNSTSSPIPTTANQIATNIQLKSPSGLALDSAGNLYVADFSNNFIEKIAGL